MYGLKNRKNLYVTLIDDIYVRDSKKNRYILLFKEKDYGVTNVHANTFIHRYRAVGTGLAGLAAAGPKFGCDHTHI